MLFAVALQMTIASYTKSFKEAQNYISMMLLIPALLSALRLAVPKPRLWVPRRQVRGRVERRCGRHESPLLMAAIHAVAVLLLWREIQSLSRRDGL